MATEVFAEAYDAGGRGFAVVGDLGCVESELEGAREFAISSGVSGLLMVLYRDSNGESFGSFEGRFSAIPSRFRGSLSTCDRVFEILRVFDGETGEIMPVRDVSGSVVAAILKMFSQVSGSGNEKGLNGE